jgi:adenine deaminase
LVTEGHVNRAVKQAISQGLPPVTAIQMATLNTAEHFGMAREVGQIAPGRYADILLVSDLPTLKIDLVIAKGKPVFEDGRLLIELQPYDYPDWVKDSVHVGRELVPGDFRLAAPASMQNASKATVNIIGVIENQAPTRHLRMQVPFSGGEIKADLSRDIAKVALVERHQGKGQVQVGLVEGFGFTVPCAFGSTVAHDSHHMIVVGTDDADMALAANSLAAMGGGQIAVRQGQEIGQIALPIAGLMSNALAQEVAEGADSVLRSFAACGCTLNNPNMQLSLLALVVIPELRISDLGLVDVTRFAFIPVIEE